MNETYTRLEGKDVGETSLILVGVHGDERCGIEAIEKLLPNLEIMCGTVLVEYGNPRAIGQKKRFTESNLNRMFKDDATLTSKEKSSYEYKRAQYLKTLLQQADVLLDVHASFTLASKAFLICEANAYHLAAKLPFDTVVSGFDDVEPGGTDYYMNFIGKVGISAECGSLEDPAATERAADVIVNFLRARGHIPEALKLPDLSQSYIRMHTLYLTETSEFELSRPFADFDSISKGEIIGIDGVQTIRADDDCIILFARNPNEAGGEAFLLGKRKTAEEI